MTADPGYGYDPGYNNTAKLLDLAYKKGYELGRLLVKDTPAE